MPGFLSRRQHFASVGSTNDVVREWLAAGVPEVPLATADAQTAGRGREGRSWVAPAGGAVLASLGFRPTWLPPERVWQLAAVVSMAMARAAEDVASVPAGTVSLKWPNDLVVANGAGVLKLAGVLGESDGLGTGDPRVVVGIGVNGDWAAADFPGELAATMTSLRELAGIAIDHEALLDVFLAELEPAIVALRAGRFDGETWAARQATTGRDIDLIAPDGSRTTVRATGVDRVSGALLVGDRRVLVGEVEHVRLSAPDAMTV
jgi:BirA family biotin operon repressor/biotin-[acetyl-CoA-carboxylase] ligase